MAGSWIRDQLFKSSTPTLHLPLPSFGEGIRTQKRTSVRRRERDQFDADAKEQERVSMKVQATDANEHRQEIGDTELKIANRAGQAGMGRARDSPDTTSPSAAPLPADEDGQETRGKTVTGLTEEAGGRCNYLYSENSAFVLLSIFLSIFGITNPPAWHHQGGSGGGRRAR
jgi:hypothetical protein